MDITVRFQKLEEKIVRSTQLCIAYEVRSTSTAEEEEIGSDLEFYKADFVMGI